MKRVDGESIKLKVMRFFWMAILPFVLVVCHFQSFQPRQSLLLSTPLILPGFSFQPLQEEGWVTVRHTPFHLAMGKRGSGPDETFVIHATLVRLAPFDSDDEFVPLVKAWQQQSDNLLHREVKEYDISAMEGMGSLCARSHAHVADDSAAKRSIREGDMVLEMLSVTCAHPENKRLGISVSYSRRYYSDQTDREFAAKGGELLESLAFHPLPHTPGHKKPGDEPASLFLAKESGQLPPL